MPTIESDWPTDIQLEIVSPLMYLKSQASSLGRITKGVVDAKVTSSTDFENGEEWYSHKMIIYSPALEDAEVEILTVNHTALLVYPCWLASPATSRNGSLEGMENQLSTFEDLQKSIRSVLRSLETTGRIQSLIARINDSGMVKSR